VLDELCFERVSLDVATAFQEIFIPVHGKASKAPLEDASRPFVFSTIIIGIAPLEVMGELGERKRPGGLADLQARAAVGQAVLMRVYSELFKKVRLKCAQVLLTWYDFDNRSCFLNAKHTLEAILKQGVVPIINENDTTSTEEIKFGDNDRLSALVASLLHADLLVMLSDVDGLYDAQKKIFEEISDITAEIEGIAGPTKNTHVARGGMKAKIDAVKIATHASVSCVIAAGGTSDVLQRLVKGERLGTYFTTKKDKLLDGDVQHEFIRSHFENRPGR
jgi:glutamate 5-kinase